MQPVLRRSWNTKSSISAFFNACCQCQFKWSLFFKGNKKPLTDTGKVFKINSLIIANIDGGSAAEITVDIRNAAGASTMVTLAKTVSVPADATLVVITKDSSIYLEEDMAIFLTASAAGDLSGTCSYDEISE